MPEAIPMKRTLLKNSLRALLTGLTISLSSTILLPTSALAQISGLTQTDAQLTLAKDSPFRDPDIIYLEADELINDQEANILIAQGQVEGRYQDKTIRADKVKYDLSTGQVIATGNVVLVNANGSTQYAHKLELSDELEAGTAADFTARFPEGGQLSAAFAKRTSEEGVELYNAYYTACEACVKNGKVKKPTWRLKARRVKQDAKTKSIRYRDAVFEFKGVPLFYTPYLAHPDPTVGRASGFMIPFAGLSSSKGLNFEAPYYVALSPYSELTLTPHVYQNVNPLLEAQYRKQFHTGEINIEGSITHAHFFDRNGEDFTETAVFTNPDLSLRSNKWRSHLFLDGEFHLNNTWRWGFQAGYATDDNYLYRYDLDEQQKQFGLYTAGSRRLMQQAFLVGQNDSFRFSTSAFGLVSLRTTLRGTPERDANNDLIIDPNTGAFVYDLERLRVSREDDSALPVIAPKIEITKYLKDPLLGGRLKIFGDSTVLTRENPRLGRTEYAASYIRATGGLDWQRNWIAPAGIEVKPFANAKYDYYKLEAKDEPSFNFSRATSQAGVDLRWPFMKTGKNINWTIEPRVQVTQSFGDGKLENFDYLKSNNRTVFLAQDGIDIDLDQTLLWSSNKATGFDLWQKGFRADGGASVSADWGVYSRASLFLGQSYYNGSDNNAYSLVSGLQDDKSDIVGQFDLKLGRRFSTTTRVRYDDDESAFRRLDTSINYSDSRIGARLRYYRIDSATFSTSTDPDVLTPPSEEISANFSLRLHDDWKATYRIKHDIDRDITSDQTFGLVYDDDCTQIELFYIRKNNGQNLIGQSSGFGIRISLLSLGDFGPNSKK